jgi:hypothetical protein
VGGVAVDWCLAWGADCGQPTADRFRRDHGAQAATDFAIAEDIGGDPEMPGAGNRVCDGGGRAVMDLSNLTHTMEDPE